MSGRSKGGLGNGERGLRRRIRRSGRGGGGGEAGG